MGLFTCAAMAERGENSAYRSPAYLQRARALQGQFGDEIEIGIIGKQIGGAEKLESDDISPGRGSRIHERIAAELSIIHLAKCLPQRPICNPEDYRDRCSSHLTFAWLNATSRFSASAQQRAQSFLV